MEEKKAYIRFTRSFSEDPKDERIFMDQYELTTRVYSDEMKERFKKETDKLKKTLRRNIWFLGKR